MPRFATAREPFVQVEDLSRLHFADPAMAHAQVRKLVLANGMRVYLMHDPSAKANAVACGVRAGSWQDPADAPGMAHFVEHVLFMGTREYPDENDFYAFLARHGGNTNAYTTVDRTIYMFDVEPEGFSGGLKRMAAFFTSPLLRDASIARERLAVDQEFRAKQRVDGWREAMVDAALSDKAHPNRYYHIGTQDSLGHVDHGRMDRWWTAHYSAHLMDLVVRGPQSLDALQAQVVTSFGTVPKRDIVAPVIATALLDAHYAARIVTIEPVKAQTRELTLKWDLPFNVDGDGHDKKARWGCELLAYLLDSQGKHALLTRLRALGLAEDIGILPRHFASGRTLLTVSFDLTDRGVARYDEVIGLFFAAMAQFADLPRLQPLVRELRDQTLRAYAYQAPSPGYDAVAKTADQMLADDFATFPDTKAGDFDIDAATWHRLLAELVPATAHINLMAPFGAVGLKPDQAASEPRMQARYAVLPGHISEQAPTMPDGFGVPDANPWMPHDFAVAGGALDAPTLEHPNHFVDDAYASIYVARDKQRVNPRISATIDIKTPMARPQDAPQDALFDLWWMCVDDQLQDLRSEAESAGLHLKVMPIDGSGSGGGIRVSVNGFADKVPALLDVVLRRITHVGGHVAERHFEALRTRLGRTYDDRATARPRDVAYATLFDWRMQRPYALPEKKAALGALQAGDLARMAQQMFAQAYTQASLFGNVDAKAAYRCYASISRYLRYASYPEGRQPMPRGQDMRLLRKPVRLLQLAPHTSGNALVMQICEGLDTPEAKAASSVLSLALEPRFFDVLRTQQQTAYSLSTQGISRDGQLFRTFSISPYHLRAHAVAERLDAFLQHSAASLGASDGISEAEFVAYKQAVRKQWDADADQVVAGNERLHWLAFDRSGDFMLVKRRVWALERLDYATFLHYARQALTAQHRVEVLVEGMGYVSE